ncbi:hypothetical protein Pmani_035788 [Petrolisthes manimaculis]|uniref:Uncharacterized protein n=1 Tax=Petrolisthes manimaculis TaxID=1843537 RepID=A0AAE1NL21_9EUCA|nr:hypothetical protein Pmani_035788 [Petrolisthes manimaculis]
MIDEELDVRLYSQDESEDDTTASWNSEENRKRVIRNHSCSPRSLFPVHLELTDSDVADEYQLPVTSLSPSHSQTSDLYSARLVSYKSPTFLEGKEIKAEDYTRTVTEVSPRLADTMQAVRGKPCNYIHKGRRTRLFKMYETIQRLEFGGRQNVEGSSGETNRTVSESTLEEGERVEDRQDQVKKQNQDWSSISRTQQTSRWSLGKEDSKQKTNKQLSPAEIIYSCKKTKNEVLARYLKTTRTTPTKRVNSPGRADIERENMEPLNSQRMETFNSWCVKRICTPPKSDEKCTNQVVKNSWRVKEITPSSTEMTRKSADTAERWKQSEWEVLKSSDKISIAWSVSETLDAPLAVPHSQSSISSGTSDWFKKSSWRQTQHTSSKPVRTRLRPVGSDNLSSQGKSQFRLPPPPSRPHFESVLTTPPLPNPLHPTPPLPDLSPLNPSFPPPLFPDALCATPPVHRPLLNTPHFSSTPISKPAFPDSPFTKDISHVRKCFLSTALSSRPTPLPKTSSLNQSLPSIFSHNESFPSTSSHNKSLPSITFLDIPLPDAPYPGPRLSKSTVPTTRPTTTITKKPLLSTPPPKTQFPDIPPLLKVKYSRNTRVSAVGASPRSMVGQGMGNSALNNTRQWLEKEQRALQMVRYTPGFIDTHCHLDFLFQRTRHFGRLSHYRTKAAATDPFPASFEGCVAVFCKPWTFKQVSWWEDLLSEDGVWGSFGCHPHFSQSFGEEEEVHLRYALLNPKTVALGEIGLDYSDNKDPNTQQRVFRRQLNIALETKKPLVIHCRDAHHDCITILKELVPRDYLIHRHCFTEGWEEAKEWLGEFKNLYLGFTNLVSHTSNFRSHNLRKVLLKIPLDRILLETDAPYFRPQCLPVGGQYSHPGMAIHVAAHIAQLRNLDLQSILTQIRDNSRNVYGI